jgi:hypothetical protein
VKIVRFKTPAGMREGRVIDEYVLHGRTRYTVQTEFGEVYVYAEDTENVTPSQPVGRHRQKPP